MTKAEKLAKTLEESSLCLDGEWRCEIADEAAALLRSLDAQNKRMAEALRAFATPKQSHYDCEDCWYSCPASEDYCGQGYRGECNCGADEHNVRLERHADALRDAGVSE